MTLHKVAQLVALILEKSPRCDARGQFLPPESIDEPEGRVQVRLSDRLANLLAHRLRLALRKENEEDAERRKCD